MRIFLDTNALIWSVSASNKLGKRTKELLTNTDNQCFWSVVSAWEIQIKSLLGKLQVPTNFWQKVSELDFEEVPLELDHITNLSKQNFEQFRDPFDSMLLTQAHQYKALFLTADQLILAAGLDWVIDTNR